LFTKTDKRIGNYIRQNGYSDAFSTINSLAHTIGTSPATMTRNSHKLDYENFQDLKFNIQKEMTETVIENSPIIQRIHKYNQQIIKKTGEFIDNDIIQTFIDKLQSSRNILFANLFKMVTFLNFIYDWISSVWTYK
ncbi:MurR/RpiR family transcriptional regulator, partial [Staphylococcus aureus]|uniref:MurR/RpiR family transcriptional regulator n=1 Tax=Staphylococcus aureus TaxID=1280 RepID=UPI00351F47FC